MELKMNTPNYNLNVSNEAFDTIAHAASTGLSNLQNEPSRLAAEAESINRELESLVLQNYSIFVENLTCSTKLREEDAAIDEAVIELSASLQALSAQCSSFRELVNPYLDLHKRNRKTLQHHMQLVELLEVPQLVDACARNNFHDEAVELAAFVNSLEKRHLLMNDSSTPHSQSKSSTKDNESSEPNGHARNGSKVIQRIVDEVQRTLVNLRQQLITELTENTTLSRELHILSILRKLDALFVDRKLAFERIENLAFAALNVEEKDEHRKQLIQFFETRLQMNFLEARSVWLSTSLANIGQGFTSINDKSDPLVPNDSFPLTDAPHDDVAVVGPYGRAIELLELCRTSWFAVVTQFIALFQDSSCTGLSTVPSDLLLGAWVTNQVHTLLTELSDLLPKIPEGTSLRTILEQALLFAHRMSDVGADFSGLIVPLFEETLVERVEVELKTSLSHFHIMVTTERYSADADDVYRDQIIPLFSIHHLENPEQEALSGLSSMAPDDETRYIAELMLYPPIAYLCNHILESVNFIRECPLLSARKSLYKRMAEFFESCCRLLVSESTNIRSVGGKYLSPPTAVHESSFSKAKTQDYKSTPTLTDKNDPLYVVRGKDYVSVCSPKTADVTTGTSASPAKLDQLYAAAVAKVLIPHVLTCFDQLFDVHSASSSVTSATASNTKRKILTFRISVNFKEAQSVLSHDSYLILLSCWQVLESAKLLPIASIKPLLTQTNASSSPNLDDIKTLTEADNVASNFSGTVIVEDSSSAHLVNESTSLSSVTEADLVEESTPKMTEALSVADEECINNPTDIQAVSS